jgi:hypothetical protein
VHGSQSGDRLLQAFGHRQVLWLCVHGNSIHHFSQQLHAHCDSFPSILIIGPGHGTGDRVLFPISEPQKLFFNGRVCLPTLY